MHSRSNNSKNQFHQVNKKRIKEIKEKKFRYKMKWHKDPLVELVKSKVVK